MTERIYLNDSYKQKLTARIDSCVKKGIGWEIILNKTIFYPEAGGQPSDKGTIRGTNGTAAVRHVRMQANDVIHECLIEGTIKDGTTVECTVNWSSRYFNMRAHSAGHVVHEAIRLAAPYLEPCNAEHGKKPYIEYRGSLPPDKKTVIERNANMLIRQNLPLKTEFVTLDELKEKSSYIPERLPKNKPLRILSIGGYPPIPDGGTHLKTTGEIGEITISSIENMGNHVRIYYNVASDTGNQGIKVHQSMNALEFIGFLLDAEREAKELIAEAGRSEVELHAKFLGPRSNLGRLTRQIRSIPVKDRPNAGIVVNEVKKSIEQAINDQLLGKTPNQKTNHSIRSSGDTWFDATAPGIRPPLGHLHIVTQAIMEITRIFEKIGFTRVRYPEADWDWYAFESLNMPPNHPARDEWETFLIEYPETPDSRPGLERKKIVLTPHTSNGQVREMEKGTLPIRMINIAKCYRRQIDISHTPMFHQFEGLYIDKHVSIGHLKGVCEYFFQQFYGYDRKARLRPFHFQFTEPSFEIDVSCGICHGKGMLFNGTLCKLCKDGWLELGGAGMVHPIVLKNGGIDPDTYTGFAFGWGIERTYMMKSGTELDDIRLLYSNDIRFLEQF